jgi:opacity protein-like surface antigen
MKMIKMALLGGAALAVSSMAAQADDLTALKAQIESLNARVASMEAAPSVPAGYSLLTVGEGQAHVVPGMTAQEQAGFNGDVTVVSVLPTADAPAGATIEWNGFVRAIIGYQSYDSDFGGDDDDLSIVARGRLNMTARTDTAVGEVGVRLRLEGNSDAFDSVDRDLPVEMEIAWGWWQMTPELTLGGGYNGSVGSIGFGYDGACTCHFIDNANVYELEGDATQMRLTYASGPMSAAIAIEDGSAGGGELSAGGESPLRFAGEIAYAGDSFSGEISGLFLSADDDDAYNVGVGLGFNLGDIASISMAAAIGNTSDAALVADADYWFINGLASMNISDSAHAELGVGYKDYEDGDLTVFGVMGGLYYHPVDQLTIGLEAEYISAETDFFNGDEQYLYAGLVTVWSF